MKDEEQLYSEALKSHLTDTGMMLRSQFDDVSKQRHSLEDRLLKDLRQYKGQYEPNVEKRLPKNRSRLFTRITRTKVKAFDARIMEMLFPANNDKNWEVQPTPLPDVTGSPMAADMLQQAQEAKVMMAVEQFAQEQGLEPEQAMMLMQQEGAIPQLTPDEVLEIAEQAAKKACDGMRTEIQDQLAEIKYRDICGKVIHSGNLYGTGIMKGPLVQIKEMQQWQFAEPDPDNNDQGGWGLGMTEKHLPYLEFVPIWEFYPDPEAKDIQSCEYMYQRHVKTRDKVAALARRPGFNAEVIKQYLKDFPHGDAEVKDWESLLDNTDERNNTHDRQPNKRYEVLEFWGCVKRYSDDGFRV